MPSPRRARPKPPDDAMAAAAGTKSSGAAYVKTSEIAYASALARRAEAQALEVVLEERRKEEQHEAAQGNGPRPAPRSSSVHGQAAAAGLQQGPRDQSANDSGPVPAACRTGQRECAGSAEGRPWRRTSEGQ